MSKVAYLCANTTSNSQAIAGAGILAPGQVSTLTVDRDSKEEFAILQAAGNGYMNVTQVALPTAQTAYQFLSQAHTARDILMNTSQVLTFASTIIPDVSQGDLLQLTLTGNCTMSPPINPQYVGQSITFMLAQGGSGNYTVTWSSATGGYKKATDGAAGATGTYALKEFRWNGTYWVQASAAALTWT
jgi:hypothetical protein